MMLKGGGITRLQAKPGSQWVRGGGLRIGDRDHRLNKFGIKKFLLNFLKGFYIYTLYIYRYTILLLIVGFDSNHCELYH